jgi:CRP-like cAMP-binding protein
VPAHLIRKLEHFIRLSVDDKRALERATSHRVRSLAAREDIVHEGDQPKHVNLMLEGFACRYKALEDGRRQIVAFLLPGEMCDACMFILKQMDHSIGALSQLKVAEIPGDTYLHLGEHSPRLARALWWNALVEESIAREWTLNLGQRDAYERTAHVMCEVFVRLRAVGLTNGTTCTFPVTQSELGDALGLSTVHINRTLQELRANDLIILRGKTLQIPNLEGLQNAALFDPNYLHLDRVGWEFDATQV